MSKLNATASINFAKTKIKWSSLKAHNHRNYYDMKHDKNKNINNKLSKYNSYGTYFNYYKFMTPYVDKSKLAKQHSKYIKQRRKSRARKFASPKAFLRSKNHRNCRCGIVTLGDHNFQNKFEEKLRKKIPGISTPTIKKLEKYILLDYLNGFNKRHKNIKIVTYAIHVDETFIHAHAEFMGVPSRTAKGKLQLNFNKSLRTEMANQKELKHGKLPSNRVALHRFQSKEDNLIIQPALHKEFGVTLVRKGASKDDQKQHSLAVSESAKASSYASIASSSASYLSSLNADFRASLSKSAEKSLKSKKRALASSAQSLSMAETKFDISAYGGYARQLSNVLTPYMPNQPSGTWIQYATGAKYITSKGKRVNDPLSLAGSISASKATSANDTYNSIRDTNSSLKNENSSLSNANSSLSDSKNSLSSYVKLHHDMFKENAQIDLDTLGVSRKDTNNKDNGSLFKMLLNKIDSKVKKAKDIAKNIIETAKRKALEITHITRNGSYAMQDYIGRNNPKYRLHVSQSDKQRGIHDASLMFGKPLVKAFNETADQVHNQKTKEKQRQPPQF